MQLRVLGVTHVAILFCNVTNQVATVPKEINMGTILLIVLILLLIGAFPSWPYSRNWGYWPSGGLGTILIIVLILVLIGRI